MRFIFPALLTIFVELAVFHCSERYRNRDFIVTLLWVNLFSNLMLNTILSCCFHPVSLLAPSVLFGEAMVWSAEYAIYGMLHGFSRHLLLFTCLTNAISFSLSFII